MLGAGGVVGFDDLAPAVEGVGDGGGAFGFDRLRRRWGGGLVVFASRVEAMPEFVGVGFDDAQFVDQVYLAGGRVGGYHGGGAGLVVGGAGRFGGFGGCGGRVGVVEFWSVPFLVDDCLWLFVGCGCGG